MRSWRLLSLFLPIAAFLVPLLSGPPGLIALELILEKQVQIDAPSGQLILARRAASQTREPVLVIFGEGEVLYIDGLDLKLLGRRPTTGEFTAVSSSGSHIAGYLTSRPADNERAQRILVENRNGVEIWSRPWSMYAFSDKPFSLTPRGYLVMHPTLYPDELFSTDGPPIQAQPAPGPYGLTVFDLAGEIAFQGIGYAECRKGLCTVASSAEGRYLAVLFRSVDPKHREGRECPADDKACLVLYNMDSGTEMWRRYLSSPDPGAIAVSPEGRRILCFLLPGSRKMPADLEMYLFDREGDELRHRSFHMHRPWDPRDIQISSDGNLAAFSAVGAERGYDLWVIGLDYGGVAWSWSSPPEFTYLECIGISTDGKVLVRATSRGKEKRVYLPHLYLFNRAGGIAAQFGPDALQAVMPGLAAISDDGSMLWVRGPNSIQRYKIE